MPADPATLAPSFHGPTAAQPATAIHPPWCKCEGPCDQHQTTILLAALNAAHEQSSCGLGWAASPWVLAHYGLRLTGSLLGCWPVLPFCHVLLAWSLWGWGQSCQGSPHPGDSHASLAASHFLVPLLCKHVCGLRTASAPGVLWPFVAMSALVSPVIRILFPEVATQPFPAYVPAALSATTCHMYVFFINLITGGPLHLPSCQLFGAAGAAVDPAPLAAS